MDTPNYNEKPLTGKIYERTCAIRIDNSFGQSPSAMTVEEVVTLDSEGNLLASVPNGNLFIAFDPNDPDDMFVYNHLNAKVIAARQARDAEVSQ